MSVLASALLALAVWWPPTARRQRALTRAGAPGGPRPTMRSAHRLLVLAVGLAPAAVLGAWGIPAGVVLAVLSASLLRGQAPEPDPGGLPLVLELLAAGLRSGAPLPVALDAVAGAGGPLAGVCGRLATSLRLGTALALPAAGPAPLLAELLLRSTRSGAAPAAALADAASGLRAAEAAAGVERARRAGVRVVLPLATCFLPAFVLVAVVPVALGLLRG